MRSLFSLELYVAYLSLLDCVNRSLRTLAMPQGQHPTARASRPTTKARNKGIICMHYYRNGVCPDTNCPFAHFTTSTRKEFPVDLCRYHDPPRKVCLRDECRFFHGTPEKHHELLQRGVTFYYPSEVLPIGDPTDVKEGEPVSNVPPNWDKEIRAALAWKEQSSNSQSQTVTISPPTAQPTMVVVQAPQVTGSAPIIPSAPHIQPHLYAPLSPPQAPQQYFLRQPSQAHLGLLPQGLQSIPSSHVSDPSSPLSQQQYGTPHGGATVVILQPVQYQPQLQQQLPPMAMPVAPTPYPTAIVSLYQTGDVQQPQPQLHHPQPQPLPPQWQHPSSSGNPPPNQY